MSVDERQRRTPRQYSPATSLSQDLLKRADLGAADLQGVGRGANDKVENSHLPIRRRERAMNRFRRMHTLQKFSSVHASVHNLFNQERHLTSRETYKARRSAALAEWGALAT